MKIEFSEHAIDQLKERSRITRLMVVGAIEDPQEVLPSFRGRRLYRKQLGEDILEVVTIKERGKIIVITQYFLEE